jgi:hypothetical protein
MFVPLPVEKDLLCCRSGIFAGQVYVMLLRCRTGQLGMGCGNAADTGKGQRTVGKARQGPFSFYLRDRERAAAARAAAEAARELQAPVPPAFKANPAPEFIMKVPFCIPGPVVSERSVCIIELAYMIGMPLHEMISWKGSQLLLTE